MLTNKNKSERGTKLPAVKMTAAGSQSLMQASIDPYQSFMTPQKIPVRHQLLSQINKKQGD